jgi:streptogramin lyase
VADRDGAVWVLARDRSAAYSFDGRDWLKRAPAPAGSIYLALAADEAGRVTLLSAKKTMYRLDRWTGEDPLWQKVLQRNIDERPEALSVSAMAISGEGTAWLAVELPGRRSGKRPEGVLVLEPDGDAQNHRFDPQLAIGGATPGTRLPTDRITSIAIQGDTVLLGTYSGLCELKFGGDKEGGPTAPQVRVIGENEGMDSEVVRDVVVDEAGRVWVASGAGAGVVDASKRRYIDHSLGLPSTDVRSLAVASDGAVWVLTNESVVRRVANSSAWTPFSMEVDWSAEIPLGIAVDSRKRLWLRSAKALLMRPL